MGALAKKRPLFHISQQLYLSAKAGKKAIGIFFLGLLQQHWFVKSGKKMERLGHVFSARDLA